MNNEVETMVLEELALFGCFSHRTWRTNNKVTDEVAQSVPGAANRESEHIGRRVNGTKTMVQIRHFGFVSHAKIYCHGIA